MASFGSVVLFACVLVLTYHASGGEAFNFWAKHDVRIINDLCNKTLLTIECASKDDNLGHHVLRFHGYFEWSFKLSWFRDTQFWCRMMWDDQDHSFDVYVIERDEDRCRMMCWWSIRKDGGYMFNEPNNDYEMLVKW